MKHTVATPHAANKGGRPRKGALQFRTRTWYAVLTIDVDGETVRKWVNLETDNKAVARRKLARLVAQHSTTTSLDVVEQAAKAPETYAELAERVAQLRRAEGIADVDSEDGRERLWVIPEIGRLPVAGIKATHISAIYERAKTEGKSLAHLRNLRTVMHSRFKLALAEDMIATNPVSRALMPKMRVDRRERAVLTDDELVRYLGWQHPQEHHQIGVLERQTMSALARIFGGLRTGDLHALRWTHFDVGEFTWGVAPRKKTARPQRIIVPEMLRPILRDWWERQGRQREGLVFPALRGKNAGEGAKQGVSHADAMRRDLRRAFGLDVWNVGEGKWEPTPGRTMTDRERELLEQTEFTRPVDFHSWRRAFVQVLGDIGVNAQQAQKLAGHADLAAHGRYLHNTSRTIEIPAGALPHFEVSLQPSTELEAQANESSGDPGAPDTSRTCDLRFRKAHRDTSPAENRRDALLVGSSKRTHEIPTIGSRLLNDATIHQAADRALSAYLEALAKGCADALGVAS
jgi:integrase